MIRPIAIYACETWATTKIDEQKLARFERKVLRQIFGPRRNQTLENMSEERIKR